jgi:hypothetical protein
MNLKMETMLGPGSSAFSKNLNIFEAPVTGKHDVMDKASGKN